MMTLTLFFDGVVGKRNKITVLFGNSGTIIRLALQLSNVAGFPNMALNKIVACRALKVSTTPL